MEMRRKIGNRTVTGPDVQPCFRGPVVLTAHACFTCRKSWKLPEGSTGICPQCGNPVRYMGRAFRAPKRGDLA